MQLRTFIAKDMRDALGQVRKEMGADAVIVASQRARNGGILVRAALDVSSAIANEDAELLAQETGSVASSYERHYHETLLKRLRSEPQPSLPSRTFDRTELLEILRAHRAPETLAHQLTDVAEKSGLSDMTLAFASALDRRMRAEPLNGSELPALLLVGPSGAGKTAMAAKLAAHARLQGCNVRLVAADTQGAGAIARLETFADHLVVQCVAADTAESVAAAISSGNVTIIDTAGFDPRNTNAGGAHAALSHLPQVETLGVVSATADAEEIAEITTALVSLGVARLVVTALDVTRRFGALLAAATQGAGLAYVTRSPFVSGGLETLTPLSLSRMLIDDNTDRGSPP